MRTRSTHTHTSTNIPLGGAPQNENRRALAPAFPPPPLRRAHTRVPPSSARIATDKPHSQGQGPARCCPRQGEERPPPEGCSVLPPDHRCHPRRSSQDQRFARQESPQRPRGQRPDQEGCRSLEVEHLQYVTHLRGNLAHTSPPRAGAVCVCARSLLSCAGYHFPHSNS
jgi:hypothetical protein